MKNNYDIEPEFSRDERERFAKNSLTQVIASLAGISVAAAGVIVARKIYEAKQEAKLMKKEEE